jgi:hypothetical protein
MPVQPGEGAAGGCECFALSGLILHTDSNDGAAVLPINSLSISL